MKIRTIAKRWILGLTGALARNPGGLSRYLVQWRTYRRLPGAEPVRIGNSYPCLADGTPYTPFDAHYFFQAWWLSRMLSDSRPALHVDVASDSKVIAVIAATRPVVFMDYRPLNTRLPDLMSVAADIGSLPLADRSSDSLSCLHVIEHVGLGRYGDPLNPRGSHIAAAELARVLAPGGRLYVSTPVGRPRLEFNAHRVFDPEAVVDMFPSLSLVSFSVVTDTGQFLQGVPPAAAQGAEYACGLFEFTR
jgi:SAM-dependent methyltransferase